MTVGRPLDALEVPGRIYHGVTDLSLGAPFGGVPLGLVQDTQWERVEVRQRHTAEELQMRVVGDLLIAEAFSLAFALRGLDNDALNALLFNTRVGAVSQQRGFFGPGGTTGTGPGKIFETGAALLFVPLDELNADAVLLPRAIPRQDPLQGASLRFGDEHLIGSTWLALPGANGLAYDVHRLVDLTPL